MEPMLLVVLVAVAAVAVALVNTRRRNVLEQHRVLAQEAELSLCRRPAETDITEFAEQLDALAAVCEVMDEVDVSALHQTASGALSDAREALSSAQHCDDLGRVSEALERGHQALAAAQAVLHAEPAPEARPCCFFNPSHGPSTENIVWAEQDGQPHDLPACAADAERVRDGADPYIRTVPVGDERVPYWRGSDEHTEWARGWFNAWAGSELVMGMSRISETFAPLAEGQGPVTAVPGLDARALDD